MLEVGPYMTLEMLYIETLREIQGSEIRPGGNPGSGGIKEIRGNPWKSAGNPSNPCFEVNPGIRDLRKSEILKSAGNPVKSEGNP